MAVGGGGRTAQTAAAARFEEAQGPPAATAFRRQDYIDNTHPSFVGTLGLGPDAKLVNFVRDECDLLINVGSRPGEIASQGYTLPGIPNPRMPLESVTRGPRSWARSAAATSPSPAPRTPSSKPPRRCRRGRATGASVSCARRKKPSPSPFPPPARSTSPKSCAQ